MLHTRKNIYFPLPPILINNIPISFNYTFKLLGIIIEFKLTWKPHIQAVQKKISSACGILFNLRNKINRDVAKTIYYTIAFPYIHYCNIIWGGSYQTFIGKLFITQKKLVRCIMRKRRDTPSNPLFKQLNILKLEDVIKVSSASFVYKSTNNLINTSISFHARFIGPYNLRNIPPLEIPFARDRQAQMFIPVKGAALWNSLPVSIRNSLTLFSFKKNIKKYYLSIYENL